ncbi:MAG TPA: pseudouridine synthase [Saprospiraceae bacterium]|nr:pseudouridine synthase [Saprospiraceae bacterium]
MESNVTLTETHYFTPLDETALGFELPTKLNFPFCYEPHQIAIQAAEQLKKYIHEDLEHNHAFGSETEAGIGKMFGVLVVRDHNGRLGFLSSFSGKLGNSNFYPGFVPPVFDTLDEEGFYKIGEAETNIINRQIETLENNEDFLQAISLFEQKKSEAATALSELKSNIKEAKANRKLKRQEVQSLSLSAQKQILEALDQESIIWHYKLKELNKYWKNRLESLEAEVTSFKLEIGKLKLARRQKSSQLQQQLFENYTFLNGLGETKSLLDIFNISEDNLPPSGAGECAAPKLLHFAFKHGYQPLTMAEFWWGKSPASEIRKHGHFYPACNSKCKPILSHMLQGVDVEDNPMLINPALGKDLPIVYEDEYLVVVNKPAEFLSVPGKDIQDSVYTRAKSMYPQATGPLIVHRLDMSTSGLMLIAKSKEIHQHLQSQFIKRKIKKRYVAILDGPWLHEEKKGEIKLPLRVDLDDRPRQLVCYQYGKPAHTLWEVIESDANETRIHFFPVTGRTHQLRVHAAHTTGLNLPIKGDDLYGTKGTRLYLHAEMLQFIHPVSRIEVNVEVSPDF